MIFKNIRNLCARLKRYIIYNLDDLKFSKYENVNLLKTGFQFRIWKPISLGGEYSVAMRQSISNISIDNYQKNNLFRLYIIYHIGNKF